MPSYGTDFLPCNSGIHQRVMSSPVAVDYGASDKVQERVVFCHFFCQDSRGFIIREAEELKVTYVLTLRLPSWIDDWLLTRARTPSGENC